MNYATARKDMEELEKITELSDWVEIDAQMGAFLRDPTKRFAQSLYESAIELWFREHGVTDATASIAKRHNIKDAR